MTLTVEECGEHLKRVNGAYPKASVVRVVNTAQQLLLNAHQWTFLEDGTVTLDLTAGSDFVYMPVDYGRFRVLQVKDTRTKYRVYTTASEVLANRTSGAAAPTGYDMTWSSRFDTVRDEYRRGFDVWPVPTATISGAFILWYSRTLAERSEDSDKIHIRPWLEPVFLEICTLVAKGWDEADNGTVDQRMSLFSQSSMWRDSRTRDGMEVPPLGRNMNGAATGAEGYFYIVNSPEGAM